MTPNQFGFSLAPSITAWGFFSSISATSSWGSMGIWVMNRLTFSLRLPVVINIGWVSSPRASRPEIVMLLMFSASTSW